MKLNLKLLLLFYLFGMGFNYLKAQSVTASAGDQNKSTKIDLNWTLGEIIVESTSKDELVLTQGFQQPKNRSIFSARRGCARKRLYGLSKSNK
jgi:hypothetical protein